MPANVHLPRGRITLDPNDPLYVTPSPIPEHARILDVGCGPGQTLIAASKDRRAYGVDVSFEALTLGRTLTGRVTFICGVAEALPFRDCSFDFVIARVSLPYTNIGRSVREIHRVLKPEGQIWAVFERMSLPFRTRLWRNPKFYLLLPYLWLNTLAFHAFGRSIPFIDGQYRGYQTVSGVTRVLKKAGFDEVHVIKGLHLVTTARRPF